MLEMPGIAREVLDIFLQKYGLNNGGKGYVVAKAKRAKTSWPNLAQSRG